MTAYRLNYIWWHSRNENDQTTLHYRKWLVYNDYNYHKTIKNSITKTFYFGSKR